MRLQLTRPLCVLDVETTGTLPALDRIVSIAGLWIHPSGSETAQKTLINPEIPIPHEATYGDGKKYPGHGITDDMVKDAPTWAQVGLIWVGLLTRCDLAGYRVKFDKSIVTESCLRERIPVPFAEDCKIIDAARLWQVLRPRTLEDAVAEFAPDSLGFAAHDALADVRATWDVLRGMLSLQDCVDETEKVWVPSLPATPAELHDLSWPWPKDALDPDGKIIWRGGCAVWTFGKHAGKRVDWTPLDYFTKFILKDTSDFSPEVKAIARQVLNNERLRPRV